MTRRSRYSPPLRTQLDVDAIKQGIGDGAIDVIASGHDPRRAEAKDQPLATAAPGMLGLETTLSASHSNLELPLETLLKRLSWSPAQIAGLRFRHGEPILPGSPANLCIFDPTAEWLVEPKRLASHALNSPFLNQRLRGRVRHTILRGEPVVIDAMAQR